MNDIIEIDTKLLDDNETQEFIQSLIKEFVNKDKVNTYVILVRTMEFVEKLRNVKDKKGQAFQIYNKLLEELHINESNEDLVNESIDIIIDLTKGKFDINKVAKCSANCFPKFVVCFPRIANMFKKCKCC